MTCALMGLQPVSLDLPNAMSAVDGATIERRIRISRPDEGRGRCKGSRAWDPRKDFSQSTPPHKTPSTSSAISPQQERTEPSGHRPCRRGVKSSLRREPDVPGDLLCARFANVTEPSKMVHPAANGLIGDHDPALGKQILDIPETQGEPDIKPDRPLDDFGREAEAAIADLDHRLWLRLKSLNGKPAGDVTMPIQALRAKTVDQ